MGAQKTTSKQKFLKKTKQKRMMLEVKCVCVCQGEETHEVFVEEIVGPSNVSPIPIVTDTNTPRVLTVFDGQSTEVIVAFV